MDAQSYRTYHEGQMMFNNGTTSKECAVLLCSIPVSVFVSLTITASYKRFLPIIEFCTIILPMVLNVTVLSEISHIVFVCWTIIYFIILIATTNMSDIKECFNGGVENDRSIVTNFRASTNFVSAICILAVDFNIFPRRFAKTENFGFGLMDLGVGFFVCSHGLVDKDWKQGNFQKVFKSSLTLFILGTIRLIATKAIGYQEHITEYGTHWNFFFTLTLLKILVYLTTSCVKSLNSFHLTLLTGVTHEILLKMGLKEWVLSDIPRNNLLSANREGLVSCLGYVCIFFAARTIGIYLTKSNKLTYGKLLVNLFIVSLFTWLTTTFAFNTIGISRRLVNLGYILWTISLSLTVIILFIITKLILVAKSKTKIYRAPSIFDSINDNGMFFFILSNLLTGLINSLFQTFLIGKVFGLLIIISYMAILCSVTYCIRMRST